MLLRIVMIVPEDKIIGEFDRNHEKTQGGGIRFILGV
jgi:hypothetical protein